MTIETRQIGLSLGADLCWPAAYEALLKRFAPTLDLDGSQIQFAAERVHVEPYDLRYKPKYDLVIDRITHWYPTTREWVKKIALMDDVYVLNNPWAIQSVEKHTSYCALMRLGFPVPDTWMIPPKDYAADAQWGQDIETTVKRYNKLFRLSDVAESVGYPAFLKPYDGGGWVGVKRVTDKKKLHEAYDESGARVQHLQAGVKDWDVFVRAIGIGPQMNIIRYDPGKALHDRYQVDFNFLDGEEWRRATQTGRIINAFFGWDFNSCEMLRSNGVLHPIDFANACPDSQVTSLHYHFPWVVMSLLKWSLYCAAIKRSPRLNPDWAPFLEIADRDIAFDEKVELYDELAKQRLDHERFFEFSETHFKELDAIALEFFGSQEFYDIVTAKVESLYPAHEIKQFSDHFFGLVQFWRKTEADRMGVTL